MPRFTVWLSEDDHRIVMLQEETEEYTNRILDIASDLLDQIAGIPEETDGNEAL